MDDDADQVREGVAWSDQSRAGGSGEQRRWRGAREERAVSHVVGVLLMIAVTVLLFSVLGVMAFGFDAPGEQAPNVATDESFAMESDTTGSPAITLQHHSGDHVDVENVRVHINTGGQSTTKSLPTTGDLSDGTWSAGDRLEVPVQTEDVCGGGSEAEIRLVHENDEGETTTMAKEEVPLQASEFEITGGSVVPEHDYEAEVEIVETEYTNWNRIEIQPVVGGNVKTGAFSPIFYHDTEPSQSFVASDVDAGTPIRVRARASNTQLRTTWVNSNDAGVGSQVWVRRDGESVPTNAGGGRQQDLEATVSEYANDGQITLDDNQALYMYELYTDNPGSRWYEYQDAVVLVTFTSAQGEPELVENGGERTVVCPA